MRYSITVIYLDKDLNILDKEVLHPWKIGKKVKGTKHILEGNINLIDNIEGNKKLEIRMV